MAILFRILFARDARQPNYGHARQLLQPFCVVRIRMIRILEFGEGRKWISGISAAVMLKDVGIRMLWAAAYPFCRSVRRQLTAKQFSPSF
eukprot:s10_g27.t1